MPYVWKTFEKVTNKLVLHMLYLEVRFYMKRLMHIILLLALNNICCFCLKLSLQLIAVMVGTVFFVTAWIGMFFSIDENNNCDVRKQ